MTIEVTLNGRLLPFIFLSFLSYFSYAEAEKYLVQPYFIIDSFSYSETVSLLSASKGWKGDDFQSGENQWTWNWVEVGVQYQHWAIGILQRYDYNIDFGKTLGPFTYKLGKPQNNLGAVGCIKCKIYVYKGVSKTRS